MLPLLKRSVTSIEEASVLYSEFTMREYRILQLANKFAYALSHQVPGVDGATAVADTESDKKHFLVDIAINVNAIFEKLAAFGLNKQEHFDKLVHILNSIYEVKATYADSEKCCPFIQPARFLYNIEYDIPFENLLNTFSHFSITHDQDLTLSPYRTYSIYRDLYLHAKKPTERIKVLSIYGRRLHLAISKDIKHLYSFSLIIADGHFMLRNMCELLSTLRDTPSESIKRIYNELLLPCFRVVCMITQHELNHPCVTTFSKSAASAEIIITGAALKKIVDNNPGIASEGTV